MLDLIKALFRKRPPTPAETAKAETQLRVALSTAERVAENSKKMDLRPALDILISGAKALAASRKLDPGARIDDWTHDSLAGYLLYLEAYLHHNAGLELEHKGYGPEGDTLSGYDVYKIQQDLAKKQYANAVAAAEKAVAFMPKSVNYLNQLATSQAKLNKRHARKTIQQILQLDPENIEALTLQHQL